MNMIVEILAGLGVGAIVAVIGDRRGWSNIKRIVVALVLAVLFFLPNFLPDSFLPSQNSNSSGDKLVDIAAEYVRSQLKSPSTAVFHSFVKSEKFREIAKAEWNVTLPSNCDIVIIDVEATNGFGGRNRTDYAVFFKNGQPIDMIDSQELNGEKLRRAISWMGY